ncbi:MAG: multifunctional CCA tRNA nucleotidyl transferase/2'3'-cyclic phosphodiesterase/2'nucleotidase/phosphatase [Alphaproteobacteria bacterium]|nr:multifunctional CCA tRNA nucleotidyl transferase/2'3'-cyclic phosphodiesterase/2'nucleotidase/phosphatase [Alphaproteobacteria bacterium]
MKIYKVGGAVRDQILEVKANDNDYVVVGVDAQEMISRGFKSVGKSFPVFLHPETKEEYALARKEIKTGDKHTDFEFVFTPDVTLREDLERRDLTCNAIAYDEEKGEYIDYFGGIKDIQNKVLRVVNPEHFTEDPLRVLRVCRFAAQLGFEPTSETIELCREMVRDGAMKHLTAERIFEEMMKALKTKNSSKFFLMMRQIGALKEIMPEVDALFEVPEKEKYHPEGNTGGHVMSALDMAFGVEPLVKFGILVHDLGKAFTPSDILPSHHGHETRADMPIRTLCKRLKVPNEYKNFALAAARWHMHYFKIFEMKNGKIYDLLQSLEIGHKSYLKEYIAVCRADFESSSCEDRLYERMLFEKKAELLEVAQNVVSQIKAQDMPKFENLVKDSRFGMLLREYKIAVLSKKIEEFKNKELSAVVC